jgi:hypothetical protein
VSKKQVFFVAVIGFVDLAPPGTKAGDDVVVLRGCAVPLVVRRIEEHFELAGDAHVCGMMEGEIIDKLAAGAMKIGNLVFE